MPPFNNHHRGAGRLPLILAWLGLAAGGTVSAYDLQDNLSYWPVGNVEWQLNLIADGGNIPNPPLQDGSTSWDDAFMVAIDAYNAIIPDDVLTLSAQKNSGIAAGEHDGVNNVSFASSVYGDAWGDSTLGISISIWSGNRRVENDILFNATKQWDAYTGPLQSRHDFRRVALHELGHSLGLDHPDEAGQTVTAIMNSRTSDVDALAQDDIDGVLAVYGAVRPLVITKQPRSQTAPSGSEVRFEVTVEGSEPISYDWQRSTNGGVSFSSLGLDSPVIIFSSVSQFSDGHQFRVVASNPQTGDSVTSEVATLTVTDGPEAPAFTVQPQDATVTAGEDVTFTVSVSGSPTPSLQWQVSTDGGGSFADLADTGGVAGATSATLQISAVDAGVNGNRYRCVATNSAGTATSTAATLTVSAGGEAPAFTAQPQDATVAAGDDVTFTVSVSGSPTPSLQWQVSTDGGGSFADLADTAGVAGATSATLQISAVDAGANGNRYRCVATNSAGTATSTPATLTVLVPPTAPGGTTATATSATGAAVSWDAVAGATGYRVDVARDPGFTDFGLPAGLQDADVGNVTSLDLSGLTTGTWYVRVRAYNAAGAGPNSETMVVSINDGRLINLSTRGQTSPGATVMIAGFVVGGSEPKELLIRAVGPTLAGGDFNIPGAVKDTRLVLTRADEGGVIIFEQSFDNWDANDTGLVAATNAVGAFPLADGSLDAAALVTLNPGAYTAQVETVTGEPGLAIVEVYETNDTGRLVNISTRGFVGEGDAIIIPGTVVSGQWKRVLVRAVGETIGEDPFNVPDVLVDPVLSVFRETPQGAVSVATNDDWGDSPEDIEGAVDAVGAFQLLPGSRDAALVLDVEGGSYTFQVSGKGGATGVVIVELYELP